MKAPDHGEHIRISAGGDARRALSQLLDGCDECLRDLAELPKPATALIELTRAAEWRGFALCPADDEIRRLELLTLSIADAVDVAAHCAQCDRCWRRLTDPAFVARVEQATLTAERRVALHVEAEVAAALRDHARRRRARLVKANLALVTSTVALAAASWWLLTTPRVPRPDVRAESDRVVRPDAGNSSSTRHVTGECAPGDRRACPVPDMRGPCANGVKVCADGSWGWCTPVTLPRAERCDNGADDDCDGEIDEGCSCRGDLTDLRSPGDGATLDTGTTVEFRWDSVSCATRPVLFRIRDLTTQELVIPDTRTTGNSHPVTLASPSFVSGRTYRWSVRVEAPGAPNNEYAAQFRTFTVR